MHAHVALLMISLMISLRMISLRMHTHAHARRYIQRPDVSPAVGWETGRDSEPAFLDMNRHALREEKSEPPVVLYQFDQRDPMNPLGLLMAYAEDCVKPVVSDFDTFLVGSKACIHLRMAYAYA